MQIPRLPVPLFAAERIADLRLKGIYPTNILMRDRQPWSIATCSNYTYRLSIVLSKQR